MARFSVHARASGSSGTDEVVPIVVTSSCDDKMNNCAYKMKKFAYGAGLTCCVACLI